MIKKKERGGRKRQGKRRGKEGRVRGKEKDKKRSVQLGCPVKKNVVLAQGTECWSGLSCVLRKRDQKDRSGQRKPL